MVNKKLKILVMPNCMELGEKIDKELKRLNKTTNSYKLDFIPDRFSNGEGKVRITDSLSNTDLYIISDVGNYDITYKLNIIMPLLYQSRQDKRKGNESLDCAIALQELENLGINAIITFDAHNPSVANAIPRLQFENFYPTHTILNELTEREEIRDMLVISPDMGAMERARYYAEMLGCDVGVFYKRRDLSKVVNGKNPIVEHMYMGANPEGKDVIIVDDMIATGGSILEVAENLRQRGVDKIYLIATFSLFTEGTDKFIDAYKNNVFDKIYSTNLSYVPEDIKKEPWYHEVDMSKYMALIINTMNKKEDIEVLYNGKKKIINKINKKKELEEKQIKLDI